MWSADGAEALADASKDTGMVVSPSEECTGRAVFPFLAWRLLRAWM